MLRAFIARLATLGDCAQAALRIVLGAILATHGWGKVSGGYAVGFFRSVGIPLPEVAGPLVSFLELGGGLCLIVGLFTRYLGVLFTVQFVVATYVVSVALGKGIAGAELELLILAVAVLLATRGAGMLSLDQTLRRWEP